MILKTFELKKLNSIKSNIFLLYGENEGYKNQIIQDYFINNKLTNALNIPIADISVLNKLSSFYEL